VVVVVVAVVVVVPKVGWRDPKGHLRVEDAAIYVHITYLYNSICIYIIIIIIIVIIIVILYIYTVIQFGLY
jgi:hypothetical protein